VIVGVANKVDFVFGGRVACYCFGFVCEGLSNF
jgi:hypothetical protein